MGFMTAGWRSLPKMQVMYKGIGEMVVWYVIQTHSGEEEKTADIIRKKISSDLVWECFVPKRERMKKFQGGWNKVEELLFHGYVFVVSEKPGELYEELKGVPKLTKMLGREKDFFFALEEREMRFVCGIGDANHKTSLSKVRVSDAKKIQVIDGPLKGYERHIGSINLHRREVTVKMELMGRELELKMGIEMVNRIQDVVTRQ